MDKIDKQILALLKENSRISVTDIAAKVNRSRVAVSNRINHLVANGDISHFGAVLRRKPFHAIFQITLNPNRQCDDVIPDFRQRYSLVKALSVTGTTDLFIWYDADSSAEAHQAWSWLSKRPEVKSVVTHVVVKTYE